MVEWVVRPEYSCSLGKIKMVEPLNDWKLDNLTGFG
jgi:hypothetical protein